MKGSFTVEASFIVPIVMAMMLFIGFAALWLYDRDVSRINAEDTAAHAAYLMELGDAHGGGEEAADRYCADNMGRYLMQADISGSISEGAYKVSVSCSGRANVPFSGWFDSLGWPAFGDIGASCDHIVLQHCDFIRACRLAGRLKDEMEE